MKSARLALVGWLIPGGAFLLSRRWVPFAIFASLVCLSFAAGVAMHGAYRWPDAADVAGLDGFDSLVAHAAACTKVLAGAPFLLAQVLGSAQPPFTAQLHEYGTTLILMSGLFNLLGLTGALESR